MNQKLTDILQKIGYPADLRQLPVSELPEVCEAIRQFIIEQVSVHPGHFASSLGAVELTVALHYVYNTPEDRLVWDVGHQAYAHKILTGRRERFSTLRQKGGLSGFPTPMESEYDTFSAGHASNSISAALGMAVANKLKGDDRKVVAVIGDASISGGMAFEGLNNASSHPNDLLIVLNDNQMAIDQNVGALYLVSSTTKVLTDFRDFENELNRVDFRYVVPDFRLNKEIGKLNALTASQKEKVEFLCNECCWFDCYDRAACYENVSRKCLGENCPDHICVAPDGEQGYRFSRAMQNPGFIGIDDMQRTYLPMGFSHFKIEGRGLGSALILEFLLYYMVKPAYHLPVREAIYLDSMLDLF